MTVVLFLAYWVALYRILTLSARMALSGEIFYPVVGIVGIACLTSFPLPA